MNDSEVSWIWGHFGDKFNNVPLVFVSFVVVVFILYCGRVKLAILNCVILWHEVHLQSCTTITTIRFQNFFSLSQENSVLIKH